MALPVCKYGKDCYRKNPQHFLEFSHPDPPAQMEVSQTATSATAPVTAQSGDGVSGGSGTVSSAGNWTVASGQRQQDNPEDLPPLLPLLRQLSDLSRQGVVTGENKAHLKELLLSGEKEQVLSAVSILDSLPPTTATTATTATTTTASTAAATASEGKEGPVLVILRGIAGSGKSTLAATLVGKGIVCSTDDFFVDPSTGVYRFDNTKLSEAHTWNQERVKAALKSGISPVLIDNTHTQRWEAKPYVLLAVKHGYEVKVAEPTTWWAKDAKELAKRNQHGVPLETIQRMLDRWEVDFSVQAILASQPPERRRPNGDNKPRLQGKTPNKRI